MNDLAKSVKELIKIQPSIPTTAQITKAIEILTREAEHELSIITNKHSGGESDAWRSMRLENGISLAVTAVFLQKIFNIPEQR